MVRKAEEEMIYHAERRRERARLGALAQETLPYPPTSQAAKDALPRVASGTIRQLLSYAGLEISPMLFAGLAVACASFAFLLGLQVFSAAFSPLFAGIGLWLPFAWLERRAEQRALEFSLDYPAVLLATASSIQVGLPPEAALLRATKLLPKESRVKVEIEALLRRLRDGLPKEQAVRAFAACYRVPELDLFRSAFLLVMETGGRFAPTLQRLAIVSTNRMTLLNMASVSTASMRMTGNVLIAIAPALLLVLSSRIDDFWPTLSNHPTANLVATWGTLMMTLGFASLRRMSRFKP